MAQQIVSGLYPILLVEPDIITRTEDFLHAHPELPSGRQTTGRQKPSTGSYARCAARNATRDSERSRRSA